MSVNDSLDRKAFQALLANAFAVQKSGFDTQSLSALIHLQHFIATDEFNLDQALHVIVEHSLKLSNASGVAIALLEANQLVYRAGSGIAAVDVGRHIPAMLSFRPSDARLEILRVENARTNLRIEAEICRQFGATALLILPIYQAQTLTGVLQVYFVGAHSFLNQEVRTYRLLAGLVEEALLRNVQRGQKAIPSVSAHIFKQNTSQEQTFSVDDDSSARTTPNPPQSCREHVARKLTMFNTRAGPPIRQTVNRSWRVGAVLIMAIVFALATWVLGHHAAPTTSRSVLSTPNDSGNRTSPKLVSRNQKSKRSIDRLKDPMAPSAAFKRLWIGPNEVDYIAEDVTVRYLTNEPAKPQDRINGKEENVGQDVTVRYFAQKSTLWRTPSASLSRQTTEHLSSPSQ